MQIIRILMYAINDLTPIRIIPTHPFGDGVCFHSIQHMARVGPYQNVSYLPAASDFSEELLYCSHLTGGMIYIYVYSAEKIHPSAVLVGRVLNQVFDTVRLTVGIIYKFIDCHSS